MPQIKICRRVSKKWCRYQRPVLFQAQPFWARFWARTKNENLGPKNDFLTKPSYLETKNIIFFQKMSFGLYKPRNRQTRPKNRFFAVICLFRPKMKLATSFSKFEWIYFSSTQIFDIIWKKWKLSTVESKMCRSLENMVFWCDFEIQYKILKEILYKFLKNFWFFCFFSLYSKVEWGLLNHYQKWKALIWGFETLK